MGEFDAAKGVLDGVSAAYEHMRKDLDKARAELIQLRPLKQKLREAQVVIASKEATRASLAAELVKMRAERDQLNADSAQSALRNGAELSKLRSELDAATGEHNRQQNIANGKITNLTAQVASLKARYEPENERLRREISSLKTQGTAVTNAAVTLNQLDEERKAHARTRQELTSRHTEATGQIANLHKRIEHEERLRRSLDEKLTLEKARAKATGAVNRDAEVETLRRQLAEAEVKLNTAIADSNRKMADANAHVGALNTTLKQNNDQTIKTRNELTLARAELSTRSGQHIAAVSEAQQERAKTAQVREDLTHQLNATKERLNKELHEARTEASNARYAIAEARAPLQERLDALQEELRQANNLLEANTCGKCRGN